MLELKNIYKTYGKKANTFTALKNINLKFEPGTTNAIIGKSGSGKSTLIHILIGLDKPTKGQVIYNGQDIRDMNTDDWRARNIGIVFQQFFLQPNVDVLENTILPLKLNGVRGKARQKRGKEVLESVGLKDKTKNRSKDLSGGQKQRVAIARALVNQPNILIADEPTGNLDSENGKVIEDLLFELNKTNKTTLILVTHDEDLAKRCDRIITVRDGQIINDEASKSKKGVKK